MIGLGLAAAPAKSTTIVWENTGTTFSTNGNWIGGTAPANNLTSDIGSFQAATATNNPNLTGNRSINGLEFTNGTAAWTFTGSGGTRTLTLGSGGIVSNDDSTQTFNNGNLRIALGANAAFTSNSTGALFFGSTLNQFNLSTFTLTLNGSSTNTSNLISEVIIGTGSLTKSGSGTWTLSGANTYTGVTTINAGTLSVATIGNGGVAGNLGQATNAAGNLVLGGGTLQYTGATASTNRNFTLTAGTTSTIDVTTNNLTISGASTNTTGGLTKTGAGTLTLSGANLYTGTTTVNAGTLAYGASNVLSTGAVTVDGGTAVLALGSNQSDSVGTVTLANGGSITGSGTSTLTSTGSFEMQSGSVTAILGGAVALNKTTTGTVTLSGANTYTGATNIGTAGGADAGTLILGANNVLPGTTVNIYGGTLDINTRTDTVGAINLGSGAAGSAANITGTSGTLTLGGNITYSATNNPNGASIAANFDLGGADRTITVGNSTAAATDLTLGAGDFSDTITMGSNNLLITGAGNTLINAMVGASGNSGGFTKDGTGTVTFYGDRNYYTGTTTVNDGTLVLDTSNTPVDETIRGNLTIGDSSGAADSATVRYGTGLAHNKIANTSQVTINSDGVLDLNSKDDTIGSFILSGGHITTGTGVLTLNGDIQTTANAADRTAVIDGVLSLGSATRTFTVADDAPTSDLTVNATINSGSIIKDGLGTMTVAGDNTIGYGGTTTVSAGVLNIQSSGALGQTGVNDPARGTTVATGAALQIQGSGIAVGTEALTLSGTGVSTDGALRNISGDNSWAGAISLGATARINSDAGTLTLNGSVTATNQNLIVGGEGDTTINGAIGTGSGTLAKDGNGTLTLTGDSTYGGTTTISDGVVNIRHNSALGSTGAGTSVASGAALQLQNNITVGSEALALAGTGVSSDGALRNISGDNTYGGAITVGTGGTLINSDAGTLTLTGNITAGSEALTIGGAGDTTLSGTLSGSSTLTKDGAGTLFVDSSLGFGGDINLTAGTLEFDVNNAFASSTLTISAGTLRLSDATLTLGTLNITGNSTIDFAGSASILDVTNLTISAGVVLTILNWQDAVDYFFADNWTGAVRDTTGAIPMNRIVFDTNGAPPTTYVADDTRWLSYDDQVTPVPEPSTYGAILTGAGLAVFGFRRWRRSKPTQT